MAVARFDLKNMCSKRCERPFSSGGSVNEPFLTAISTVTSGTEWSSRTTTSRPFASLRLTHCTDCGAGRAGAVVVAATPAAAPEREGRSAVCAATGATPCAHKRPEKDENYQTTFHRKAPILKEKGEINLPQSSKRDTARGRRGDAVKTKAFVFHRVAASPLLRVALIEVLRCPGAPWGCQPA